MSTDFFNISAIFKTNTDLFKKTIQEVPPDRWFVTPGNDSNHLMWIAGHVVVHRAKVLRLLGQEWSAPWEGLFARGTKSAWFPSDTRKWRKSSRPGMKCPASCHRLWPARPRDAGTTGLQRNHPGWEDQRKNRVPFTSRKLPRGSNGLLAEVARTRADRWVKGTGSAVNTPRSSPENDTRRRGRLRPFRPPRRPGC